MQKKMYMQNRAKTIFEEQILNSGRKKKLPT